MLLDCPPNNTLALGEGQFHDWDISFPLGSWGKGFVKHDVEAMLSSKHPHQVGQCVVGWTIQHLIRLGLWEVGRDACGELSGFQLCSEAVVWERFGGAQGENDGHLGDPLLNVVV